MNWDGIYVENNLLVCIIFRYCIILDEVLGIELLRYRR